MIQLGLNQVSHSLIKLWRTSWFFFCVCPCRPPLYRAYRVCVYVGVCVTDLLTYISASPKALLHGVGDAEVVVATTAESVPSTPHPEVPNVAVVLNDAASGLEMAGDEKDPKEKVLDPTARASVDRDFVACDVNLTPPAKLQNDAN
jgi:hypothetical protein